MKRVLILAWWLSVYALAAVAQTQRVAGIIVTGDNHPAVGAAVVIDGTNIGAVTNLDGKFIITDAPVSAKKLRVYHVGMKIKEVPVAPNVYIVLEPKAHGLTWNARAGVSLFSYRKTDGIDDRVGFTAGVGTEYIFSPYWAVQTSLTITNKGSFHKEEGFQEKINPVYLDIPILAAFKIPLSEDINFVMNAGPYLAIGLGGKGKLWEGEEMKEYKMFSGSDALMKRFDVGFQGGIGFEGNHILINVSVQHGFLNPVKKGSPLDWDSPEKSETHYPIGGLFTIGYRL